MIEYPWISKLLRDAAFFVLRPISLKKLIRSFSLSYGTLSLIKSKETHWQTQSPKVALTCMVNFADVEKSPMFIGWSSLVWASWLSSWKIRSGGAPSTSSYPPLCIQLIKVPQHEDFESCCDFCLLVCCLTNFSWSRIRERVCPNEVECPSYDPRDVSSSSSSSARPLICSLTSSTLQAFLQA